MIHQVEFQLPPFSKGFHIITNYISGELKDLPEFGLLNIFCKHTSAGLSLNENADPSVLDDFEKSFNNLVKEKESFYTHTCEGDDDMPAHIKTSLVGSFLQIPIANGKLNLGMWQGIYLCEFRNHGGPRTVVCTIYS
jgi:secondary thiamine-phosphate synthase enzyme